VAGDCRRGARGSDRPRSCSWSDSVAEVDERREALSVLSGVFPRETPRGLARPCASIGERRSVGSWIAAAKPRDQWRARTSGRVSGLRLGNSPTEVILGRTARSPLTRGRVKRFWR